MKVMLLTALMFFVAESYAHIPTQNEVRLLYHEAATKEQSCKKLVSILEPYNETNNVLFAGYKGSATMMMAKYVFNPFTKLSNFYKGRNLLENCINSDQQNIELRFLRFSIQTNVPFFLGYKSSIKQDKTLLLKSFATIKDNQLMQLIFSFLIHSNNLSAIEKQNLKG